MKTIACATVATLLLLAAAAGVLRTLSRSREAAERAEEARAVQSRLEIAALRESNKALETRVAALEAARSTAGASPQGAARSPAAVEDPNAGLAAAEDHGAGGAAPALARDEGTEREEKLDRGLEILLDPKRSWNAKQGAWKDLTDAGLLDRAVEVFEERAKENPGSADAQSQVGLAYLEKLNTVMSDVEKGTWATKADRSFDAALAIDDHHWEARFTKAMSLSFWPPVFGKQAEAIHEFETLRAQQAELPAQGKFAETYLLLGNMYRNRGETAKAMEVWKDGAERFPGNKELGSRAAAEEGK